MYQYPLTSWNITQASVQFRRLGKNFNFKTYAIPKFEQFFPHVLFLSNLYLFSILIYKEYFYDPTLARRSTTPLVRNVARVWNVVCSIFSTVVFLGVYPCVYPCVHTSAHDSCLFWIFIYCWTKPLELIDTVLLMAAGREIKLVHWSHHVITMLFTWFAAKEYFLPATVFSTMNLAVHAVMYGYYFLVSFACWRSTLKRYAFIVTWLQMLQFLVCLYSMYHFYELYSVEAMLASGAMYVYYFILFAQLYQERFSTKTNTVIRLKVQ